MTVCEKSPAVNLASARENAASFITSPISTLFWKKIFFEQFSNKILEENKDIDRLLTPIDKNRATFGMSHVDEIVDLTGGSQSSGLSEEDKYYENLVDIELKKSESAMRVNNRNEISISLPKKRNSFSDDDLEAYDLDDTFDLSVEEKLARMSEKAKEKDIKKKQEELEALENLARGGVFESPGSVRNKHGYYISVPSIEEGKKLIKYFLGMIIFDQPLEQWIDKAVKQHCTAEKELSIPASVYYLIGSFASDGDFHIAHAAKCPVPATALEEGGDSLSKSLDDEWISDNAEKLVRMLPGGVHLVGLGWFSSKSVYTNHKNTISRTLARIQRSSNQLTTMNLASVSDHLISVFVETPNGKPIGQIIEVVRKGPDSPTKISFSKLEWISLVSNASARINVNVPALPSHHEFYNHFRAAISKFAENLLECEYMLFDNQLMDKDDPLFKDAKKGRKNALEVQLFIDPCYQRENSGFPFQATNLHEILFDLEIRAAVPSRSKVEAAMLAVKHHLIRTLAARAELHYESMEIVEEPGGARPTHCSVHQLPRPATTVLYGQSSILISDYLFEADTVEDAQRNIDEMLEMPVNIEHVDEGWERALEPQEMEMIRAPIEDQPLIFDDSSDKAGSWMYTSFLLIALAVLVAFVGIFLYYAMNK
ncbi:hypothetical protein WR25_20253 [Diploscapter pachys]|uniref:Uncharacterized protein n=1 Tax=Diploscapter pachys TaxID=2018661 RepID=A0A2A2LPR7_9BILA|nr:hypothetical protein WR25_20253 [Diploscapter pachys]